MNYTKAQLFEQLPKEWKTALEPSKIFNAPFWDDSIIPTLNKERFLPKFEDIFSVFKLIKPSEVKVVLLGQDPYPNEGDAHGLSFSVQKGRALPASLKIIYEELTMEYNINPSKISTTSGNLEEWVNEGVLLLNTVLTVKPHEPDSHAKLGWENFTLEVLKYLAYNTDAAFLLLGQKAQKTFSVIESEYKEKQQHQKKTKAKIRLGDLCIIKAAHPSPMARRYGFLGSNCFRNINTELIKRGILPIRWAKIFN